MSATTIEWTDATWNPVTGCTKISPGCDHCYAETIAHRFAGGPAFPNGFDVTLHGDRLSLPLRWRRPRRVFVNSMSDLFHDAISDDFVARVFAVMACTGRHSYQVLTKRHARMRSLLSSPEFQQEVRNYADVLGRDGWDESWPLRNVWLGVSAEDQQWADIRIPALLETPAALRFVSAEPLLGPIDLRRYLWLTGGSTAGPFRDHAGRVRYGGGIGGQTITSVPARDLHWVIAGGESGPGARPMNPEWARSLRDQCAEAGVAFFFKQLGTVMARHLGAKGKGTDPASWPIDFPQQYPEVTP